MNEWVADWADRNTTTGCTDSTTFFGFAGTDIICFGGGSTAGPGALIRGGSWRDDTEGGVFTVSAFYLPSDAFFHIGFRCAR